MNVLTPSQLPTEDLKKIQAVIRRELEHRGELEDTVPLKAYADLKIRCDDLARALRDLRDNQYNRGYK